MSNIVLNPTQSAYVSYGAPNNNYDANDYLRCGVQSSTSTQYRAMMQFSLAGIPSNSIIDNATLKWYSFDDGFVWNTTTTMSAKRATTSWSPGVTFNTRPSISEENLSLMTDSGYNTWYEWNVKDIVQDWSDGANNYGFYIRQDNLTIARGKVFKRTGTYAPVLEINYTPIGMQANVNGTWKSCLTHAKVSGSWELCKSFINDNGTWKQAK